jgi:hypothetical protein
MIALLLSLVFSGAARAEPMKHIDLGNRAEKLVVKIQKPEIAIVLTKQNLTPRYDLELKESFLPKVIESVEKKPF